MVVSVTTSDEDREKAAGVCTTCGELFTVWLSRDGSVQPVSPHNVCSCAEPSPRAVDEDEIFDGEGMSSIE